MEHTTYLLTLVQEETNRLSKALDQARLDYNDGLISNCWKEAQALRVWLTSLHSLSYQHLYMK